MFAAVDAPADLHGLKADAAAIVLSTATAAAAAATSGPTTSANTTHSRVAAAAADAAGAAWQHPTCPLVFQVGGDERRTRRSRACGAVGVEREPPRRWPPRLHLRRARPTPGGDPG